MARWSWCLVAFVVLSGRFPPPPDAVLADDLLAISGDTGRAVITVAAEFAGFVAGSSVAERVASGHCPAGCSYLRISDKYCESRKSGGQRCIANTPPNHLFWTDLLPPNWDVRKMAN